MTEQTTGAEVELTDEQLVKVFNGIIMNEPDDCDDCRPVDGNTDLDGDSL